jgi:hypothetical protein
VALTSAVCEVPEEAPQEVVVGLLVELQRAGVLQESEKLRGEALAQLLRRKPHRNSLRQETRRKETAREAVRSTETRRMGEPRCLCGSWSQTPRADVIIYLSFPVLVGGVRRADLERGLDLLVLDLLQQQVPLGGVDLVPRQPAHNQAAGEQRAGDASDKNTVLARQPTRSLSERRCSIQAFPTFLETAFDNPRQPPPLASAHHRGLTTFKQHSAPRMGRSAHQPLRK